MGGSIAIIRSNISFKICALPCAGEGGVCTERSVLLYCGREGDVSTEGSVLNGGLICTERSVLGGVGLYWNVCASRKEGLYEGVCAESLC